MSRVVPLIGRNQSEVARRGHDAVIALEHAEYGYAGRLERPADLIGVPDRTGLVEDDAHDPHGRVEGDHALDDSRDRPGGGRDVDDQHDRGSGHGCHVGGRGETVAADLTVIQAHDALDDRDVRAGGTVEEQRDEPFLADQVRVEVATGLAGGERVIAGVDVVGPDLVA